MAKKRKRNAGAFFGPISHREDALQIMRECTIAFGILSGWFLLSCVIVNEPGVFALMLILMGLPTFAMGYFHSRFASAWMTLLTLPMIFPPRLFMLPFGILFFIAGFRALQACIALHGRFKKKRKRKPRWDDEYEEEEEYVEAEIVVEEKRPRRGPTHIIR